MAKSLTLAQWRAAILSEWPNAEIGTNRYPNPQGDLTATIPCQLDIVGVFSAAGEYCMIYDTSIRSFIEYDVTL